MLKSLDQKLAAIHADPSACREFILADAKDADMAFGMAATGTVGTGDGERFKTLAEYREQIRSVVRQGIVDIMLMSASTSEQLTLGEKLFDGSPITPAIRANDAPLPPTLAGRRPRRREAGPTSPCPLLRRSDLRR